MAIRNGDGTLYCGESISELLGQRFAQSDHPYLSDILGSDWGMNQKTGETFKVCAYRVARMIYPDEGGNLYPPE